MSRLMSSKIPSNFRCKWKLSTRCCLAGHRGGAATCNPLSIGRAVCIEALGCIKDCTEQQLGEVGIVVTLFSVA
jgi:hypothetical protein